MVKTFLTKFFLIVELLNEKFGMELPYDLLLLLPPTFHPYESAIKTIGNYFREVAVDSIYMKFAVFYGILNCSSKDDHVHSTHGESRGRNKLRIIFLFSQSFQCHSFLCYLLFAYQSFCSCNQLTHSVCLLLSWSVIFK